MSPNKIIKKCFKCNIEKSLSEFYRHKEMLDGHLNKCKECAKKDSIEHRNKNIDKAREYDRNRPNAKERIEANKKYISNMKENNREKYENIVLNSQKKWSNLNRKKRNSHNIARRKSMKENLKPNQCSLCGKKDVEIQGHHFDYDKPSEVTWLCVRCHGLAHRAINEDNRTQND